MVFCTITKSHISKIDKPLFEALETEIKNLDANSDKDDFDTIKRNLQTPPNLSPENFAFEVIYVILAGGFSQKTAKRVFEDICTFLENGIKTSPHPLSPPLQNGEGGVKFARDVELQKSLFAIFHNKNKTNAIAKVWNNRQSYCEQFYALETDNERLNFLEKLPHIGKITKNHIARNLGISVVKYDVWIQRLGIALYGKVGKSQEPNFPLSKEVQGYCDKMFADIKNETNLPIGYIDVVLWKSCQIGLFSLN